jgi:hypothetical protein
MTVHRGAIVAALLQRANREGVAKIVDARITPDVRASEPGTVEQCQEDIPHTVIG